MLLVYLAFRVLNNTDSKLAELQIKIGNRDAGKILLELNFKETPLTA